jgi:uncharacterized integral membrane protein (TIGR00698 family)
MIQMHSNHEPNAFDSVRSDHDNASRAGNRHEIFQAVFSGKELNVDQSNTCPDSVIDPGGARESLAIKFRFIVPPEVEILLPGLMLTAVISAMALHTGAKLHYVTPLIAAMAMGMVLRNAFILPTAYKQGIFFSMRQVLRFAVALLGVRITFEQITGLGWEGAAIALVPLTVTLLATVGAGKVLRMDPSQTLLIATGTSICGASAILTAGAITRSREEHVIVAISSITIFGTVSMLFYPLLHKLGIFHLSDAQYGFWAGASIHEVAQVIAAAFGGGEVSGEIGTIIKLTRVAALVPVAFVLSYLAVNRGPQGGDGAAAARVAFPYFLLGFVGMVVLNSLEFFTPKAIRWIELFDMFLLTMAMAGMGLETDLRQLMRVGYKPVLLSICSTATIAVISMLLIKLLVV